MGNTSDEKLCKTTRDLHTLAAKLLCNRFLRSFPFKDCCVPAGKCRKNNTKICWLTKDPI